LYIAIYRFPFQWYLFVSSLYLSNEVEYSPLSGRIILLYPIKSGLLHLASAEPLMLPALADLRVQDRLFLNWPSSSAWPVCAALAECLLDARGLEPLPFDRPETDTDMDIDIDVDADNDVEMDARLPALSQSLDLAFPLVLAFGLTGHRSAAAASASLDVPVNVETGLVFVEASVCVSKLVRLLNEAAELSCPWAAGVRAEGHAFDSELTFARPDPSSRPNLMYRSDCDDFLVFEDSGFTQPPSSSTRQKS